MAILLRPSALRYSVAFDLIFHFFDFLRLSVFRHTPPVFPSNRLLVLALLCAEFGHNPCCLLPLKEVSAIAQPTPGCTGIHRKASAVVWRIDRKAFLVIPVGGEDGLRPNSRCHDP